MDGGSVVNGIRLPKFDEAKELLVAFIANFEALPEGARQYDAEVKKYQVMLQAIVDRKRVTFAMSLDDLLAYGKGDTEELVDEIEANVQSYVDLLYEIIDELAKDMTISPGTEIVPDPLDILQAQRVSQLAVSRAAAGSGGGADGGGDGAGAGASEALEEFPSELSRRYQICLTPSMRSKQLSIRQLKSEQIGTLVTIKGIVTRVNDVKPRLVALTYMCEACGYELYQILDKSTEYTPLMDCKSAQCKTNAQKGNLYPQTRGSRFEKFQEIRVQETPDQVPMGHIPRSMAVWLKGELTRTVTPGDVVTLSGSFLPKKVTGFEALRSKLVARTFLEASAVTRHKKTYAEMELSEDMERRIDEAADDPTVYERLSQSIAPEIYGHDDVKKALLLLLTGAATRKLPDGMKIRGDVNVLLMGDPGVAKSQLLKHVASLVPRGIYTTGKGSSSVGLTAAVVRDPLTQEMTLEGGALVLADMGICCIDEFDKMDDNDRTAIHEVMEQQTVSIAKAGITTTLNARCAILAAANPVYGRYNRYISPEKNINMPNALLSRFDLLFLILDLVDTDLDADLARHITYVHKHMRNPQSRAAVETFDKDFLKAYISQAKKLEPRVPVDLTSYIVEAYVGLRQQDAEAAEHDKRTHVMTARQLLSILRLSQALARLRFSNTVSEEDVDEAMRLVHMSKASLLDDDSHNTSSEDVTSRIYAMVRDFAASRETTRVKIADIEPMCVKKGFKNEDFKSTLDEYSDLNVWMVNEAGTHLDFMAGN